MRLLLPVLLFAVALPAQTVFETAPPLRRPAGAPRASDVILRTLLKRPANANDPHDTLRALNEFHVSRLEWSYIGDAEFIAKVKAPGRLFGNAAAAPSFRRPEKPDWTDLACLNAAGEPVIASWKRTWKPTLWACMNNPDLRDAYLDYLKHLVDIGSDVIQRDEPEGNAAAVRWGACFCDHCLAAFRAWLGDHTTAEERRALGLGDLATFNYRETVIAAGAPVGDGFASWDGGRLKALFQQFQEDSTTAFNLWAREEIDRYAGRRVPMSCNNGVRRWEPFRLCFDWAMGELSYRDANAPRLHDAFAEARSHGKLQVVTMPLKSNYDEPEAWTALTRRTIAWSTAFGGWCMVPWDTYLPGDAPRYFGTPEQYADLYAFTRALAPYLDDYSEACVVGEGFPADAAAPIGLVEAEDRQAVLRVVPGDPTRPAVIHIISGPAASPTVRLRLDPQRFWGDRALRYRWLTPQPYDPAAHAAAAQARTYEGLVATTDVPGGRIAQFEVPAPSPWGVLVVEPAAPGGEGLWAPLIEPVPAGWYQPEMMVTMRAVTPDTTVRYTIDGSLPTAQSPAGTAPVKLAATTTITARAFRGEAASAATRVTFERLATVPPSLAPDAPGLKADLRLWLQASETGADDGQPVTIWPATTGAPAELPRDRLLGDLVATGPTLRADALNGHPGLVFDGADALVVVDFANRYLAGGPFTIFVVSQSDDDAFGLCGNAMNGNGGIPRLYLTRRSYHYDALAPSLTLPAVTGRPAVLVYSHDGRSTTEAWCNGASAGRLTDRPAVPQFGGGHLAMPFWGANQAHAGVLGEVVVYRRVLSEVEREGVAQELASRFGLPYRKLWR